jgi:hypothetical protein
VDQILEKSASRGIGCRLKNPKIHKAQELTINPANIITEPRTRDIVISNLGISEQKEQQLYVYAVIFSCYPSGSIWKQLEVAARGNGP